MNTNFNPCLSIAAALLLLSQPAQLSAAADDKRASFAHEQSDLKPDKRVIYGVLDNGLRYAVMKNSTPTGVAALRMRIATGSLNETDAQQGIAHFLEHMAFNGSKNVPEGEMVKRLERHGLSFGADTNASTGFSRTLYKLNLPSVDKAVVDEAFFLMRETAENLTLDAEAIDRERGVIASEKLTRDSVGFRSFVDNMGFFTKGAELLERLPIGKDETIASMPRSEFVKFYRGYYHPKNTFVVFVGDLDTDIAIKKIEATFGDWRPTYAALSDTVRKPAEALSGKLGYYHDDEILTYVTLAASRPFERKPDSASNRKLEYLRVLGSRILARRLKREADNGNAPYLSAQAGRYAPEEVIDGMTLRLRAAPEKWKKTLAAGDLAIRQILSFGFLQSEVDEEIARTRRRLQTAADGANTRKTYSRFGYSHVTALVNSFSKERVHTSPEDGLARFESYAEKITAADVARVFRSRWASYVNPAVYLSTSAKLNNPQEEIRAALKQAQLVAPAKKEERATKAFAYTGFGAPGTVASQKYDASTDAHLIRFNNNVRLNFKQTDYSKDTIFVRARIGSGFMSMPRKNEGLRRLADNLVRDSGVAEHTSDDLQSLFAGKRVGARFRIRTDNDAFEFAGATNKADLTSQFNLMAARVTAPAYRKVTAEKYRNSMRAWYPSHDSTPRSVARKELPKFVRSGDLRYGHSDLKSFLTPTIKEVQDWIDPQLKSGLIEITVVGDVDKDTVIAEVARTFGALPERADKKNQYPAMQELRFPDGNETPTVFYHQGTADQAMVRVYWPAPDASDPTSRYKMQILRGLFRNRLSEVLREEMGATYSPGAGAYSNNLFKDFGYIFAHVITKPEMADEVRKAVLSVSEDLAKRTIDEDAFLRAVTPVIEDLGSTLQNNGYWMSVLGDAQTDGNGIARHSVREKTLRSMTVNDINELAAIVFRSDKSVSAYIMPEAQD